MPILYKLKLRLAIGEYAHSHCPVLLCPVCAEKRSTKALCKWATNYQGR